MKNNWLKITVILFLIGGTFFVVRYRNVFWPKQKQLEIVSEKQETGSKNTIGDSFPEPFFISGWLPYWSKNEGVKILMGNLDIFDEINPFAFGVDAKGNILDIAKINNSPWLELREEAQDKYVEIVPTILWGDAQAMHKIFTDSNLRKDHIQNIMLLLKQNNFSGVDIDYEGKDVADRDNFTAFLYDLHEKLSQDEKSLSCTVEARTDDFPPVEFSGTRAMSWANDFSALNNFCDSVRVMAYDQVFQIHRANTFTDDNEKPSAPNAGNQWVEEVMRYALRFIKPDKLILGVPTYGWEFKLEKISGGFRYTRVKSVSFPEALEKARTAGITPIRNEGGELSFVYKISNENHLITFSDAQSVKQKIILAKKLGLKGISLFKLDGLADPQLFSVLEEEKSK